MEGSNADEFELHRAVFDNDLRKLNQIIKHNKEVIDRKVSENWLQFLSYRDVCRDTLFFR